MMNEGPRIIVLNGIGSVGKSSIARALQAMTVEPFLHVQLDMFIAMLPAAYQETSSRRIRLRVRARGWETARRHPDRRSCQAGVARDAARDHRHGRAGQ